jgi:hypothetical protein
MAGKRVAGALLAAAVLTGIGGGFAHASSGPQTPVTVYPADAQGNRISQPGYWDITAKPGSTTKLYAVVGDVSNAPAAIRVLSVDATNATFGGLAYNLPTTKVRNVGTWVKLPTAKVSLNGNKGAVIPFSVKVPRGTKPGQYVGGVSAYVPSSNRQTTGKAQVIVQPRVVTAVVVTVPGPQVSHFAVANVKPQYMSGAFYVVPHIQNTGNVLLKGTGYLWVYQSGHAKPIIQHPLSIDTTLPHSTIAYPFRWSSHPAKTTYKWVVKMSWNGGSTKKSGTFVIK